MTGFNVGVPEFRNRGGEPVWYGGGKLAADLSLPKLETHWGCRRPSRVAEGVGARVRLRHEIERAAARAGEPAGFFDQLRQAGVLVKERHSQINTEEITGYAVALPHHQPDSEPNWHSGGSLAADLSLPRLQARWSSGSATTTTRTSRLSPDERQAVWDEATDAARSAAAEIRRYAGPDPAAAADTAQAAARGHAG